MPILDATQLERLTRDIFAARGVPARRRGVDRRRMLVRANLRGHDSHGVIRVPQYVGVAQERATLNPTPQMQLVVDTPTIAILDGDGGFGQVVARRGIALAIERARAHGLAAVALRGANHVGRLADYAEMAAARGARSACCGSTRAAASTWRRGAVPRAASAPTRTRSRSRAPTARWRCRTTSPPACGPRASCA